jgi:general secretion pathway protein G
MKSPSRRHPAAFTLIELMATITIMVILAGIVIGGMGYVNEKQAREKAKVQIALLSRALEEYKLDTGSYPAVGNSTAGTGRSNTLFQRLYWDGAKLNPPGKIYLAELDPANNRQGWVSGSGSSATIVDPWGYEYRYRSATNTSGAINEDTYNPDFDLWSVGKDNKTKAGKNDSPTHADNRDDIRNF